MNSQHHLRLFPSTPVALVALLALLLVGGLNCAKRIACESTEDCPDGNTCLIYEGVCVDSCIKSEDCPTGDCFYTSEFEWDEQDGYDGPGICESGCHDNPSACGPGSYCHQIHDVCIPNCRHDADCAGDTLCDDEGVCVDCLADSDCGEGRHCTGGICFADDDGCDYSCSCSCSCGTATITSNTCMDCNVECAATCQDMCGY